MSSSTPGRVVVTGSSGFLGTALVAALRRRGDSVVELQRRTDGDDAWDPSRGLLDVSIVEGAGAVVVLNGAGIADKRWTANRKNVLRRSRIEPTALMATRVAEAANPPSVIVAASAIGFYGDTGDAVATEASPSGADFLADLCADWEAAADPARDAGVRVVHPRTGIVMSPSGGALKPLMPMFKLGLGGKIGNGSQWWSWITIDDHVRAMLHCIDSEIEGPVNVVAPNPVTNAEFTRALGGALGRPTVLSIPKRALDLRLGRELASSIGYGSQRVEPSVLAANSFTFKHPLITDALASLFG